MELGTLLALEQQLFRLLIPHFLICLPLCIFGMQAQAQCVNFVTCLQNYVTFSDVNFIVLSSPLFHKSFYFYV